MVTLLNDLGSEVAVRTLPLFLANVLDVKAGWTLRLTRATMS